MKKKVFSQNAASPIGPYSQAVLINNTLYSSGQIALDPLTNTMNIQNITQEVHTIFNNIRALLNQVNFTKSDIVKTSIFLVDLDFFDEFNELYTNFFNEVEVFPARETVQVSRLPKNANVEISFIAVKQASN